MFLCAYQVSARPQCRDEQRLGVPGVHQVQAFCVGDIQRIQVVVKHHPDQGGGAGVQFDRGNRATWVPTRVPHPWLRHRDFAGDQGVHSDVHRTLQPPIGLHRRVGRPRQTQPVCGSATARSVARSGVDGWHRDRELSV